MKHRCYLFDFDGTLVDSMPTYVSCMRRILADAGIPCTDEIVKIITPLGLERTAEYFIRNLGMRAEKEELLDRMREYMLDAYASTIPAKAHVIPVLRTLKERGASLNVLTASPHVTLDVCLKRLGMWELFDHIWSCEDFSTTKADPQIYVRAAEKLRRPVEEVLFLDDNLNADTVAKAAGMQVCGVYDESSADCEPKMRAVADYYIYDFLQLPEL